MHTRPRLLLALGVGTLYLSACSGSTNQFTKAAPLDPNSIWQHAAAGGYVPSEAQAFIEFCVDLDSQDDRLAYPANPTFVAQIDSALWHVEFDSRQQVAQDYVDFTQHGSDVLAPWKKLYQMIGKTAGKRGVAITDPTVVAKDPDLNGFGPWQTAWVLYSGAGPNTGKYAIAIRGTVFSSEPSALEDAIFQPLGGKQFQSKFISFSREEDTSLHGGFAHATFVLMLDQRYGVLQALKGHHVPDGAAIYIVGHSQGAAMATMAHAFLFNAMVVAEGGDSDPLELKSANYKLKSYAFAQPKPGNYPFAAEFASYTQGPDSAIVINNDIDPVPKVPLTLESTADMETDFHGKFLLARALRLIGSVGKAVRGSISFVLDEITRKNEADYGAFYQASAIAPTNKVKSKWSWDFVPDGRVLTVYGTAQVNQQSDIFYQHHATTYRDLIKQQLQVGGSPSR
jgi:pimeloyl-ACP methyl ester carboxylesterase